MARFAANSVYVLRETAANDPRPEGNENYVLPAGSWTITIGRDNGVEWETTQTEYDAEDEETWVNRTLDVGTPVDEESEVTASVIGAIFPLYNDRQPTVTFDVNDNETYPAVLADGTNSKTETVSFGAADTRSTYTIKETNPTRRGYAFVGWNTEKEPTETNPGKAYAFDSEIRFFRQNDDDDLTLYAQWSPVKCKITDRNDNLLYVNGAPAVYMTLKDAFTDFNTATFTTTAEGNATATQRKIQMLVASYEMTEAVELVRGKTAILTTAAGATAIGGRTRACRTIRCSQRATAKCSSRSSACMWGFSTST